MSIILLADDSPHAQRMGERILRDEGFEVVSVTDGETALVRMADVDPDLVIADVFLPSLNGFELCRTLKPRNRHVRIILTAGLLEPFDEEEARRAGCDAILKKPFEASVVMSNLAGHAASIADVAVDGAQKLTCLRTRSEALPPRSRNRVAALRSGGALNAAAGPTRCAGPAISPGRGPTRPDHRLEALPRLRRGSS